MGTMSGSATGATIFASLVLLLLSPSAIQSDPAVEIEPDHGLASQKSADAASPAMKAFFHSENPATQLPEAAAATDPLWDLTEDQAAPEETGAGKGSSRRRKALMTVGIVFGVVGVGLAGIAGAVYLVHRRRTRRRNEDKQGELRVLHQLEPL